MVDALSVIVHKDRAYMRGKCSVSVCARPSTSNSMLRAGSRGESIILKTVKAVRKDVTAKCYGGDISPKAQAPSEAKGKSA